MREVWLTDGPVRLFAVEDGAGRAADARGRLALAEVLEVHPDSEGMPALVEDLEEVAIEPRELAHLKETARQARFQARSTPLPGTASILLAELKAFRGGDTGEIPATVVAQGAGGAIRVAGTAAGGAVGHGPPQRDARSRRQC